MAGKMPIKDCDITRKKGVTKMSQVKRLSKQREKVSERREVGFRPTTNLFNKLTRISKKRKISMNQVVNELVENGIKEGVNTLARI